MLLSVQQLVSDCLHVLISQNTKLWIINSTTNSDLWESISKKPNSRWRRSHLVRGVVAAEVVSSLIGGQIWAVCHRSELTQLWGTSAVGPHSWSLFTACVVLFSWQNKVSAPLTVFIRRGHLYSLQFRSYWLSGDTWAGAYHALVPVQVFGALTEVGFWQGGPTEWSLCRGGLDQWPRGRPGLIWSFQEFRSMSSSSEEEELWV